jgi:hypothetical protein
MTHERNGMHTELECTCMTDCTWNDKTTFRARSSVIIMMKHVTTQSTTQSQHNRCRMKRQAAVAGGNRKAKLGLEGIELERAILATE